MSLIHKISFITIARGDEDFILVGAAPETIEVTTFLCGKFAKATSSCPSSATAQKSLIDSVENFIKYYGCWFGVFCKIPSIRVCGLFYRGLLCLYGPGLNRVKQLLD